MEPLVLVEARPGWYKLVLNRPDKLNAVNEAMLTALLAALDAAEADKSCRAVLLTGTGRGFCSGQELNASVTPGNNDASFSTTAAPGGTSTSVSPNAAAASTAHVTHRAGIAIMVDTPLSESCLSASRAMGVLITPGITSDTFIPVLNNSMRRASVIPTSANLVEL